MRHSKYRITKGKEASAQDVDCPRADAIEKMRKTRADLLPHQLEHLVDGCRETITVLAAGLGIVGLAATTTLDELGRLADDLARVELMAGHEIVGEHHAQQRLVLVDGTDDADQVVGNGLAHLEDQVLGCGGIEGNDGLDDAQAIDLLGPAHQLLGHALHGLGTELVDLFLHVVVLVDILRDDGLEVLGVVKERLQVAERVLEQIDGVLADLARHGLDAAHTSSHAALANDLEEADAARGSHVDTAAELARGSEADHTHAVAILLAEEGDGAQLLGLLHRHVAMLVELEVLADKAVDQLLHTAQLLVSDFRKWEKSKRSVSALT